MTERVCSAVDLDAASAPGSHNPRNGETYGANSVCWSFSGEGYVGLEYVRCSAMRPGRFILSFLEGSSAFTSGAS